LVIVPKTVLPGKVSLAKYAPKMAVVATTSAS